MLDTVEPPIAFVASSSELERFRFPRRFAILLLALSWAAQAQVYKWTDADGQVHYGNVPPPVDAQSTQTLDIPSRPTPAGEIDNVRDLRRATRELRELRAANRGVPVGELDRPTNRGKKSKTKEPPYIGYEDRVRIDNLRTYVSGPG